MRRIKWISIWIGCLLILSLSGQAVKETTIRNVTEKTVRYWIKTIGSEEKPQKKSIHVGDIQRYRGYTNYDIIFEQGRKKITRTIYRGRSYSFRLNENYELELYAGSHGREDAPDLAPYVSTPMAVVEKMLEMAGVDGDDILYDLGCGDGRIVITAAKKYGARGVGVDIDPMRISESNANAILAGVEGLVEFQHQDAMRVDFSEATVLALYLLPESLELLRPLFERMLKTGTHVISHNYAIPGWEQKEIDYAYLEGEGKRYHTLYLYLR